MKDEPNKRNYVRLLAMHHIQMGRSLEKVADIVQHHYQTVHAWLKRFRNNGFSGLLESPRSGAPRKLTPEQEMWLHNKLLSLSQEKQGGYITGKELLDILVTEYNADCKLRTVYNAIHRLGFSWITSRSMHPKADEEAQEAYKKTLQQ